MDTLGAAQEHFRQLTNVIFRSNNPHVGDQHCYHRTGKQQNSQHKGQYRKAEPSPEGQFFTAHLSISPFPCFGYLHCSTGKPNVNRIRVFPLF
jgi:hypothetical protein